MDNHGYIRIKAPDHPLALVGWVREHRLVLFDVLGPGAHACHRCGELVEWGRDLEVDHLDRDRQNNRVENLRVACRTCQNQNRGAWGRKFQSKNKGSP